MRRNYLAFSHPAFGQYPTRGYQGLSSRLNRKILDVALLRLRFCSIGAPKSERNFIQFISNSLLISDLTRLEIASAIARWVRMDEISEQQACLLENTFVMDVHSGLFVIRQLTTVHYYQVEKWLSGRKTTLRTLDALHIACSWNFRAVLVTCDLIMHRAAEILAIANTFISPPTNV